MRVSSSQEKGKESIKVCSNLKRLVFHKTFFTGEILANVSALTWTLQILISRMHFYRIIHLRIISVIITNTISACRAGKEQVFMSISRLRFSSFLSEKFSWASEKIILFMQERKRAKRGFTAAWTERSFYLWDFERNVKGSLMHG